MNHHTSGSGRNHNKNNAGKAYLIKGVVGAVWVTSSQRKGHPHVLEWSVYSGSETELGPEGYTGVWEKEEWRSPS